MQHTPVSECPYMTKRCLRCFQIGHYSGVCGVLKRSIHRRESGVCYKCFLVAVNGSKLHGMNTGSVCEYLFLTKLVMCAYSFQAIRAMLFQEYIENREQMESATSYAKWVTEDTGETGAAVFEVADKLFEKLELTEYNS